MKLYVAFLPFKPPCDAMPVPPPQPPKSQFSPTAYQLIETMLFIPAEGFVLLERHLERLKRSAQFFQFPFNQLQTMELLSSQAEKFSPGNRRVRLLLDNKGRLSLEDFPIELPKIPQRQKVVFSPVRMDANDLFLQHKTTRREIYDAEYTRCHKKYGVDEVLFMNDENEITEGSRTNIFARLRPEGTLFTPPVNCGLLPGTFRQELLATGNAKERPLSLEEIKQAHELFIGNSVRGPQPCQLIDVKT